MRRKKKMRAGERGKGRRKNVGNKAEGRGLSGIAWLGIFANSHNLACKTAREVNQGL